MYDSFTRLHALVQNGTAKSQQAKPVPNEQKKSNDYCWRALGTIFDDSCTLLGGAKELKASCKL